MHELLRQLLVDVPNIAALDSLKMIVEFLIVFFAHVVLREEVIDERISNVIVRLEVRDRLGLCRWKRLQDLACH